MPFFVQKRIGVDKMKAILTVIGKDKVGIIAGVSTQLQKLDINILDVNQTIMEEYFHNDNDVRFRKSMNTSFEDVKTALISKGERIRGRS